MSSAVVPVGKLVAMIAFSSFDSSSEFMLSSLEMLQPSSDSDSNFPLFEKTGGLLYVSVRFVASEELNIPF